MRSSTAAFEGMRHETALLSGNRQSLRRAQGRAPGVETREVSSGINVDLDAGGNVIGFDIDHASAKLDLATLETEALPVRSYKAV